MAKALAWMRAHKKWLLLAAVLLFVDRLSKVWALMYLTGHGPVKLATYFWLNYVENTGAAFGMFQHGNGLLIVVMLAVIGYIIYSWKDLARYGALAHAACLLILTGALGNLYDRMTLGFVVDFIDWRVWPVFNVADACITVGAVLLGVCLLRRPKPEEKA